MRLAVCIVFALLLTSQTKETTAQVFGGGTSSSQRATNLESPGNQPSVYYYGQGQGVQIDVNLWGEVKVTGKMVVPYTTDIISLISLAGGPTPNAKLDEIRIIRYSQADSATVEKIIRVNIERFVETGEQLSFPSLLRGDTVIVPGGALSALQNFVNVVQLLAAVLNTVFLFVLINNQLNN
jgi:hypothetical protein